MDELPDVTLREVDPVLAVAAALPILLKILSLLKIRKSKRKPQSASNTSTTTPPDSPVQRKKGYGILTKIWFLICLGAAGTGVGIAVLYSSLATTLACVGLLFLGSRLTGNARFSSDIFIAITLTLTLILLTLIPVDHGDVLVSTDETVTAHREIQAAIQASREGASVRILPGVYNETIYISKPVLLQGLGVSPDAVVVHGDIYLTSDTKISNLKTTGRLVVGDSFLGGSAVGCEIQNGVLYLGTHPFSTFAIEGCDVGQELGVTKVLSGVSDVKSSALKHDLALIQSHTTGELAALIVFLQWVDTSAHWIVVLSGTIKSFWTVYGQVWFSVALSYTEAAISAFSSIFITKLSSLLCGAVGIHSLCPSDRDESLFLVGEVIYDWITYSIYETLLFLVTVLFTWLPDITYTVLAVYLAASQYMQLVIHFCSFIVTMFLLYKGSVTELVNGSYMQRMLEVSKHIPIFLPVGLEYLASFFMVFSCWMVLPFLLPFVDQYVTLMVVHIVLPTQSAYTLLKWMASGKHRASKFWWVALISGRALVLLYPRETAVLAGGFYFAFRNKGAADSLEKKRLESKKVK